METVVSGCAPTGTSAKLQVNEPLMSGAQMVVTALELEGVKEIWGYPGGAVLPIYDALAERTSIKHVLVRHEQAAIHAADGFARATGRVGVSLVTSGPGVTNAVTGIATAYFDSIPLVVITANVPTFMIGEDAFQECDAVGITRSITKHNFLVRDINHLFVTLKHAFHIARSGRPGPVVVDIPKDILLEQGKSSYPSSVNMRSFHVPTDGAHDSIAEAVKSLLQAKRPFILCGGGINLGNASSGLETLLDLTGWPVATTLMALGTVPSGREQNLGMPGMHGTVDANMAMQNCDVMLCLGARLDDRVIGNVDDFCRPGRTIIHVDIDPSSISKRVKAHIGIVGDVGRVMTQLVGALKESTELPLARNVWSQWLEGVTALRAKSRGKQRGAQRSPDRIGVAPQTIIETLSSIAPDSSFICSDVGQHQMWAAQFYPFSRPRQWINSGGLGTMGVALPYAMGVKQAFPDKEVIVLTGDGSIQMCIQELSTCYQYGLDVKVICLNNRSLGMVKQLQAVDYAGRYTHSYMDSVPDFAAIATAYGHTGLRVERESELRGVLETAMAAKGKLVFVDITVPQEASVWPMIRSGRGLGDMIFESHN